MTPTTRQGPPTIVKAAEQLLFEIDFLGYVIRPTHTTVRRRVVAHAREALSLFEQRNSADGVLTLRREQRQAIGAVWASYQGHFKHANSHRLIANLHRRHPWLTAFEAA